MAERAQTDRPSREPMTRLDARKGAEARRSENSILGTEADSVQTGLTRSREAREVEEQTTEGIDL
jgi:hypothetical protein